MYFCVFYKSECLTATMNSFKRFYFYSLILQVLLSSDVHYESPSFHGMVDYVIKLHPLLLHELLKGEISTVREISGSALQTGRAIQARKLTAKKGDPMTQMEEFIQRACV